MEQRQLSFSVYRGVQKPLVFRMLKGRFIWWGVGSIFGGLMSGMIVVAAINIGMGLLALLAIGGGGFGYTLYKQKQGLYSKTVHKDTVFILK